MRTLALLAALVLAPIAGAGGFATVQLSSLPTDVQAGSAWSVEMTIMAHGRTPLDGLSPYVEISGPAGRRIFPAEPTGKTGVYRAEVVFPSEGKWSYSIWDGYTQTHTYAPVSVGAPGAAGEFPTVTLAAGLAAALALGVLAWLVARRRPQRPQPGFAKS